MPAPPGFAAANVGLHRKRRRRHASSAGRPWLVTNSFERIGRFAGPRSPPGGERKVGNCRISGRRLPAPVRERSTGKPRPIHVAPSLLHAPAPEIRCDQPVNSVLFRLRNYRHGLRDLPRFGRAAAPSRPSALKPLSGRSAAFSAPLRLVALCGDFATVPPGAFFGGALPYCASLSSSASELLLGAPRPFPPSFFAGRAFRARRASSSMLSVSRSIFCHYTSLPFPFSATGRCGERQGRDDFLSTVLRESCARIHTIPQSRFPNSRLQSRQRMVHGTHSKRVGNDRTTGTAGRGERREEIVFRRVANFSGDAGKNSKREREEYYGSPRCRAPGDGYFRPPFHGPSQFSAEHEKARSIAPGFRPSSVVSLPVVAIVAVPINTARHRRRVPGP